MSIQRERYEGPIAFVCDNCTEVDSTLPPIDGSRLRSGTARRGLGGD
jgi:hypothetical protein